jgi:hypothetical protein
MDDDRVHVVRVNHQDGPRDYLTLLKPDTVFAQGLTPKAIVGVMRRLLQPGEKITPDLFILNRPFVDFLHGVLARYSPGQPACQAEARQVGEGFIYILDQRTPTPEDEVPPEDIIGALEVRDGNIIPDSYRPNPNHLILSARGFFRLDDTLHGCLMQELAARNTGG